MRFSIHSAITTLLLSLCVVTSSTAHAADNTVSLKGTITLGRGGYGLRLGDGKLIRFMGRGGNTVFAACHKGDNCEITGVVTYDTRTPLFLSVTHARKLKGPAQVPTVDPPMTPATDAAVPPPAQSGAATSPPEGQTAPAKTKQEQDDSSGGNDGSPLLLDDPNNQ